MEASVLAQRLSGRPWAGALPHHGDFDPHNDLHVDEVAGFLIDRFRGENDVEALALLYELCHRRLREIARQVTRQLALAIDPEDLVSGFMSRLFTDVRRPQPRVRRFLGLAHTAMRNDARNQLRQHARAWRRMLSFQTSLAEPVDPSRELDDREQTAACARLGLFVLALVAECFHGLSVRDRQALLLREVEGQTYEQVAAALGVPNNQIGTIIKRARGRLARRMAAVLGGEADSGGEAS